ncbi:MAG: HEAT repeat domain-containing protein [Candidatus Brocadiia bacterium]
MASADRAVLELKLRAQLQPRNVTLLLELGELCQRLGLEEEAYQAFQRVLELDPANPTARQGRLHCLRTRYAQAAARDDCYQRAAIVHQAGELCGREAAPWLAALLDGGEPVVCQKAAEALGRIGQRAAVPALVRLLRNDPACAWWQAAEALGHIGDHTALPSLLDILRTGSSDARAAAAHAVGLLGDPAALGALSAALADPDSHLRWAAARALGDLADARAVPALGAALEDRDPEVRSAAAASLGPLLGEPFHPSVLWSAPRRALRWWKREGRYRVWDPAAPPRAALEARRRRRADARRRGLLVGGVALAFTLLGIAAVVALLSTMGESEGPRTDPRPPAAAGR